MRVAFVLGMACLACARQPHVEPPPVLAGELTSSAALTGLGDTYVLAGEYANAVLVYDRLIASSRTLPESLHALLRISEAKTFAGDIPAAERTISQAIQLARSASDRDQEYRLLSRLIVVQHWHGQLAEAEQNIAELNRVAIDPSLPEPIRRAVGTTLLQLSAMMDAKRGDELSATRQAEEYIRRRQEAGVPSQREMTLGVVAAYLGHHDKAVALLERAPERETMPLLQYWLGVSHDALGHHEKALEYFERVSNWQGLGEVDRVQLPLVRDRARRKAAKKH